MTAPMAMTASTTSKKASEFRAAKATTSPGCTATSLASALAKAHTRASSSAAVFRSRPQMHIVLSGCFLTVVVRY